MMTGAGICSEHAGAEKDGVRYPHLAICYWIKRGGLRGFSLTDFPGDTAGFFG